MGYIILILKELHMDDFVISGNFPGIVTLKKNSHKMELDQAQFFQILVEHKPKIEEWLHKHGALLFRGFPLSKADDFTQFIESLNLGQFVNYIGGDSPRDKVASKVYTSTEAPPSLHIPLHQELSFIKKFPKHIYFFCEIAPSVGGSTIIGDARKIYESVRPDVRIRFQ
jgi:alpha-ketoglutarate-dependent taurine dioxygenase